MWGVPFGALASFLSPVRGFRGLRYSLARKGCQEFKRTKAIIMAEINKPFLADWPETAQVTDSLHKSSVASGIFQLTKETLLEIY
jgi:hypothetical protein